MDLITELSYPLELGDAKFVSYATAKEGSRLHVSPDLTIDAFARDCFTARQHEKIAHLLEVSRPLLDAQHTVSRDTLVESLSMTKKVLEGLLTTLRSKSALLPVVFQFNDGSYHNRVVIESLQGIGSPPSKGRSAKPSKKVSARKLNSVLLEKGQLPVPPRRGGKPTATGVTVKNGLDFSAVLKAPTRPKTKLTVAELKRKDEDFLAKVQVYDDHNNKHFVPVAVRTRGKTMDSDDLMVVHAITALVSAYHRHHFSSYSSKDEKPINVTPIRLDYVLEVMGKGKGHNQYAWLKNCLAAITDTTFDTLAYKEYNFGFLKSGWASEEFRFLTLTTISDTREEVDSVVNPDAPRFDIIDSSDTCYYITLDKTLFESVIYDPELFVYPTDLLSTNSSMFFLYARLRNLFGSRNAKNKRVPIDTEFGMDPYNGGSTGKKRTFDFLSFDMLLGTSKRPSFSDKWTYFRRQVNDLNKPKHQSDVCYAHISEDRAEPLRFFLFGYECEVNPKTCEISVIEHTDLMIALCKNKLDYDIEFGDRAPVAFPNTHALDFKAVHKTILKKHGITIERFKFHVTYTLPCGTTFIQSNYMTNVDRAELVGGIANDNEVIKNVVKFVIDDNFEMINHLESDGRIISLDDLNNLYALTDYNMPLDENRIKLIIRLNRNAVILSEIVNNIDTGFKNLSSEVMDRLLKIFQEYDPRFSKDNA